MCARVADYETVTSVSCVIVGINALIFVYADLAFTGCFKCPCLLIAIIWQISPVHRSYIVAGGVHFVLPSQQTDRCAYRSS